MLNAYTARIWHVYVHACGMDTYGICMYMHVEYVRTCMWNGMCMHAQFHGHD